MTARDLTVALGLGLAGFLLVAGISLRDLHEEATPKQSAHTQQDGGAARPSPAIFASPEQPQLRDSASPGSTALVRRTSPSEAAAPSESVEGNGAPVDESTSKLNAMMPVIVAVRRLASGGFDVMLRSLSTQTLELDIALTDAQNGARAQTKIEAAPHGTRTLGISDGWQVESGDQITLRSPPFRERVIKVP